MNTAIEYFLDDLRLDARTAAAAGVFGDALRAMDLEADGNPDAGGMIEIIGVLVCGSEPLETKIAAVARLCEFDGRVAMTSDGAVLFQPRKHQPNDR